MQIQSGRFYKTREGNKVGPAARAGSVSYPWVVGRESYPDSGAYYSFTDAPHHLDLVAECVEAAAKFKVGDRVRCVKSLTNEFTAGDEYIVRYYDADEDRLGVEAVDVGDMNGWAAKYFVPIPATTPAIGDWVAITAERYTAPDAEVGRLGQVRAIAGGMYNVRVSETGLSYAFSVDEIEPAEKPAFVYKAARKETTDDARSAILGAIEEFGERAWNDNLLPAEFQPPAVARLMRAAEL